MQHRLVFVYRCAAHGDCSNNGITARNTMLQLIWGGSREQAMQYAKDKGLDVAKCLYLVNRELWGEDASFATPLVEPQDKIRVFGGNYVEGDSACYKYRGSHFTRLLIPVHDRYETQEEYDFLSR